MIHSATEHISTDKENTMRKLHILFIDPRLMMISLAWTMMSIGFAVESNPSASKPVIEVRNAWVRAVLPVQKSTALYMTIINNSNNTLRLVDVKSNIASHTMIHRTVEEEGIAKMRHQDSLVITPKDAIVFRPGGLHVMFMGLNQAVSEGDTVDVILIFDDGRELTVEAVVRA
jgi:hypothetical protein